MFATALLDPVDEPALDLRDWDEVDADDERAAAVYRETLGLTARPGTVRR